MAINSHNNKKILFLGDAKTVMVPPFADSISEGDVRWDKGMLLPESIGTTVLVAQQ